jgi:hypothetical protein
VDQLSTWLGLTLFGLVEINPLVARLIEQGVWPLLDAALIILTIAVTETVNRAVGNSAFLLYPATMGLLRLAAGLRNLTLFLP